MQVNNIYCRRVMVSRCWRGTQEPRRQHRQGSRCLEWVGGGGGGDRSVDDGSNPEATEQETEHEAGTLKDEQT